jgi:hypothetical protein
MRCKGEPTAMPSQCAISSDSSSLWSRALCSVRASCRCCGMQLACTTHAAQMHTARRARDTAHTERATRHVVQCRARRLEAAQWLGPTARDMVGSGSLFGVYDTRNFGKFLCCVPRHPQCEKSYARVPRLPGVALPHGAAAHGRALPPRVHACACARPCAAGATASPPASARAAADRTGLYQLRAQTVPRDNPRRVAAASPPRGSRGQTAVVCVAGSRTRCSRCRSRSRRTSTSSRLADAAPIPLSVEQSHLGRSFPLRPYFPA